MMGINAAMLTIITNCKSTFVSVDMMFTSRPVEMSPLAEEVSFSALRYMASGAMHLKETASLVITMKSIVFMTVTIKGTTSKRIEYTQRIV